MSWQQVLPFNLSKMGTKSGWCLQNVRLGFGIDKGTFPSAKADMESQKKNGTLHSDNPPANVAVPVYVDSTSKYEHVVVCDKGVYYSDGKRVNKPAKTFGWGELCDGVRVVKWVDDPKPEPTKSFLPAKGYWCRGDKDPRIDDLSKFMYKVFPAYTNVKALGPVYGPYLEASIKEFQRRTGLVPDGMTGPKTYAKLQEYGFKY